MGYNKDTNSYLAGLCYVDWVRSADDRKSTPKGC